MTQPSTAAPVPALEEHTVDAVNATPDDVVEDLLEEISIDGMCGVY